VFKGLDEVQLAPSYSSVAEGDHHQMLKLQFVFHNLLNSALDVFIELPVAQFVPSYSSVAAVKEGGYRPPKANAAV
jgi:hypothetical protein